MDIWDISFTYCESKSLGACETYRIMEGNDAYCIAKKKEMETYAKVIKNDDQHELELSMKGALGILEDNI